MTDPKALYAETKPDIEAISTPLFDLSKKFLAAQGDFLPHAAVLTSEGRGELVGAMGEWSFAVSGVAEVNARENTMRELTRYESVQVDGLQIFYREAGPPTATTILLLRGFPWTSRMYEPLFQRLVDRYHLIAPDYPGFGHSDAPPSDKFAYTFDNLATIVDHFAQSVHATSYVLHVQDYGGPVGMRLAIAHPERVKALIIQNATSHEDGLGPLWDTRKAFWNDRSEYETAVEQNLMSLAAARQRHVDTSPDPGVYDPDLWTDEYAMWSRPSETAIQSDLFYDYRTNVASYPAWQAWLRKTQPMTLVIWGRYDPSQLATEAAAYGRDLPHAEIHVMDAGHFALDLAPDADAIADRTRDFLGRNGLQLAARARIPVESLKGASRVW